MPQHGPTTSRPASAIKQLRLDAWQPVTGTSTSRLLGSLNDLLGEFAPRRPMPVVPAQRTVPEVAARLRRGRDTL